MRCCITPLKAFHQVDLPFSHHRTALFGPGHADQSLPTYSATSAQEISKCERVRAPLVRFQSHIPKTPGISAGQVCPPVPDPYSVAQLNRPTATAGNATTQLRSQEPPSHGKAFKAQLFEPEGAGLAMDQEMMCKMPAITIKEPELEKRALDNPFSGTGKYMIEKISIKYKIAVEKKV